MASDQKHRAEQIISAIEYRIEAGSNYSETCAVIRGELRIGERTFDKYWKEAQERHSETLAARNARLREVADGAAEQAANEAVMTKRRRQEIAAEIAEGKGRKINGELYVPSDGDRIRALDYLSKIDGDYAPTKNQTELTGSITPDKWLKQNSDGRQD